MDDKSNKSKDNKKKSLLSDPSKEKLLYPFTSNND
jgi:hypothetical protein